MKNRSRNREELKEYNADLQRKYAASKPAGAASGPVKLVVKKDTRLVKPLTETPLAQAAAPSASVVAAPAPVAAALVAAPAAVQSAGSSPRQACEDRMLVAFQICMAAQCAKPAFSQHPICIERKNQDQRRQESEQQRR